MSRRILCKHELHPQAHHQSNAIQSKLENCLYHEVQEEKTIIHETTGRAPETSHVVKSHGVIQPIFVHEAPMLAFLESFGMLVTLAM